MAFAWKYWYTLRDDEGDLVEVAVSLCDVTPVDVIEYEGDGNPVLVTKNNVNKVLKASEYPQKLKKYKTKKTKKGNDSLLLEVADIPECKKMSSDQDVAVVVSNIIFGE
jgi:alkylated DNA repair dioxygenase AlkB